MGLGACCDHGQRRDDRRRDREFDMSHVFVSLRLVLPRLVLVTRGVVSARPILLTRRVDSARPCCNPAGYE